MAAVASYLEARLYGGQWLVRIENIDPPREEAGAADRILATLEAYGFEWDGPTRFQGDSADAHAMALRRLADAGCTYACGCSRSDLEDAPRGPLGIIYPGSCRRGCDAAESAVRVLTNDEPVRFTDRLQGEQVQRLESESGDFIVRRRDGLVAYHLAVVVDDELQGVTEIVRGIDLMDSTPRQIWLQKLLGYETPAYAHIPVAVNEKGQKLSKSHGAGAVPDQTPAPVLVAALVALQQQPPVELAREPVTAIWSWAFESWRLDDMIGRTTVPVRDLPYAAETGYASP